jgi:hypothetical protein
VENIYKSVCFQRFSLRIEPAGLNAMLASDGAAGALEKASRASVWQTMLRTLR